MNGAKIVKKVKSEELKVKSTTDTKIIFYSIKIILHNPITWKTLIFAKIIINLYHEHI